MEVDYEGRKRYNDRRNESNKEILINKLNDEDLANDISSLLDEITKMRHEIHTTDALFNSESGDHEEQLDFLDNINEKIKALNLNSINLITSEDIVDDNCIMGEDESIDDYVGFNGKLLMPVFETYEEAYEAFINQKEEINNQIEKWLKEFDEKYGTNYTPSGKWRM